jgi:hypothetical protein
MFVSNVTSGGANGFELRGSSTTGKPEFLINGSHTVTSGTSIVGSTWHHVAGVYDGANVRLYVDGVSVGTPNAFTGNIVFTSVTDLRIGNRSETTSFPFTGSIDDIRIYSRGLSAEDVAALAIAPVAGEEPNWHICAGGIRTGF